MKVGSWDPMDRLMDDSDMTGSSSPSSSMLNLLIKIASMNKTIHVQKSSYDAVSILKAAIASHVRISPTKLLLIHNGKPLNSLRQLAHYGIVDGSTIYVLVAPLGFPFPCSAVHDNAFKVILMVPDRKTVVIDFVKPWFRVRDIKVVMGSSSGFPLDKIVILTEGGRVLEDDALAMMDCANVNGESVIYARIGENSDHHVNQSEEERFQIVLCDCDRVWQESIFVSASETVSDTKKKMGEMISEAHPDRLFLFHGKNTPQLDDKKTLGFYGIKDKSVVWLLGPFLKLYVKVPQMGAMFELKVCSDYLIDNIKHLIFKKTGIPRDSQTLIYAGTQLVHLLSLHHYNIKRNSTIYAIIGVDEGRVDQDLNLFIAMRSYPRPIWIKVKPWFTMFDVKVLFESKIEVPICHLSLLYNDETLENWKTIANYGFFHGSTLVLEIHHVTSEIYINKRNESEEGENKSMVNTANGFHNFDDVMNSLPKDYFENINGQPSLFLDEASLAGNKILAQFEIKSQLVLSLDRLIQINVKDVHGNMTKVDLKPCYDIGKVKTKVEERCGIPRELQMLTYCEDELDDKMVLGQCEVVFGSLWSLRWMCGGSAWSFFWPSYKSSCSNDMEDKKWRMKIRDFHGYI